MIKLACKHAPYTRFSTKLRGGATRRGATAATSNCAHVGYFASACSFQKYYLVFK